VRIRRRINDDIVRPIAEVLNLLDSAPDSLPHQLPPRVVTFLVKALSEGHDGSRADTSLISARGVIKDPGCPDFGGFGARRGRIPELNWIDRRRHYDAGLGLGGGGDGQNEHLG
jgi:hypothetical protein